MRLPPSGPSFMLGVIGASFYFKISDELSNHSNVHLMFIVLGRPSLSRRVGLSPSWPSSPPFFGGQTVRSPPRT